MTTIEPEQKKDQADPAVAPSEEKPALVEKKRKRQKKSRSAARQIAELPLLVLVAFVIAIVIKTFIVQAFFIPSGSMVPTLRVGDRVLVEKISYRIGEPSRGDVIVFARDILGPQPDVPWYQDARNFLRELVGLPVGDEEDFIKRVVATAGDTVRYEGNPRTLFVNDQEVDQPFINRGVDRSSPTLTDKDCERLEMEISGDGCLVPAGRVFVMGDNRGNSQDSRFLGPIEEDKIIGKAFVVIWPLSRLGSL